MLRRKSALSKRKQRAVRHSRRQIPTRLCSSKSFDLKQSTELSDTFIIKRLRLTQQAVGDRFRLHVPGALWLVCNNLAWLGHSAIAFIKKTEVIRL